MISESFSLSTLVISILLMLVCVSTMKGNKARQILALFFGLVAMHSVFKYVGISPHAVGRIALIYLVRELISVIIPQVIYRYVLELLGIRPTRRQYLGMAALPFAVFSLSSTYLILTRGFTQDAPYFKEAFFLIALLISVNYIVFVALSFHAINRHVRVGEDKVSPHTRVVLFWVRWLLDLLLFKAILALVVLYMFSAFLQSTISGGGIPLTILQELSWIKFYMVVQAGAMLLATSLTAYYALRNPDLFDSIRGKPNLEQTLALAIVPGTHQREIKKGLPDEDILEFADRIRQVVEKERLFLNPSLTARDIAEQTRIPQYKVTQALNKGLGKNFNEFVNEFRIAHAKQLLSDPGHANLTILGIAQESGFASSAPFYSAFKKFTGQSPSEFREVDGQHAS